MNAQPSQLAIPKTTTAAGLLTYASIVASVTLPINSSNGSAQLLQRFEDVLVVPGHLDFLHLDVGHLAVLVHDDGGTLAAVEGLDVEPVLLDHFPVAVREDRGFAAPGVGPRLARGATVGAAARRHGRPA